MGLVGLPPVSAAAAEMPCWLETASLTGANHLYHRLRHGDSLGLTQSGFSQQLAKAMAAIPGGAYGFLAISIVAFVVLGSVLEGIPAIVLFGPLLFPIAKQAGGARSALCDGRDPSARWASASFAPAARRVGYLRHACAISKISPDEGLKHIWGYVAALYCIGLRQLGRRPTPWLSDRKHLKL